MTTLKRILARVSPPILLDTVRMVASRLRRRLPEWEYIPGDSFPSYSTSGGWAADTILSEQVRKWNDFLQLTEGSSPLGIDHHAAQLSNRDYRAHNIVMTFGYILALAARKKSAISILDWGSGVGHYYVFARTLLPDIEVDYHGIDLPSLCEAGRRILPEATFYDTDEGFDRSYDLVIASGSIQYVEDWASTLSDLSRATSSHLYVVTTVVRHAPTFVVVQRPHKYGYETELTQWIFNRDELIARVEQLGFRLCREFLNEEMAPIKRAPERGATMGFLFTR